MRVLLSYHYFKNVDIEKLVNDLSISGYPVDIMADSGAYSAFTLGAEIVLEEYLQWIKHWEPFFTAYANLDVIGDPQATLDNQKELEAHGVKPLPIHHVGDSWHYLDDYIKDYDYIMLGGMVPYAKQKARLMPWLIECFKRAKNKAVYHGLGLTSWYSLSALPWYSVDSSSWASGFRFGHAPVFYPKSGKMQNIQLGNRQQWNRYAHAVRALGFNSADYADRARSNRAKLCQIGAASYMAAEKYLRRRHGNIQLSGNTGLNLYLVDGSIPNLIDGAYGIRCYLSPGKNASDMEPMQEGIIKYLERGF